MNKTNQSQAINYSLLNEISQFKQGKKLIDLTCPQTGDRILDLGCGTGDNAAILAEIVGLKGEIIAVDPDSERLTIAISKYSKLSQIRFLKATASNFPYSLEKPYDLVFSNMVLHWISDIEQPLNRIFQSLKPGGKFGFTVPARLTKIAIDLTQMLPTEKSRHILDHFYFRETSVWSSLCKKIGFEISYQNKVIQTAYFHDIQHLIDWWTATTHGQFDATYLDREKLANLEIPKTENGQIKHDSQIVQFVAIKPF